MLLVLVGGVMTVQADDYKLHGSWDYSNDAVFSNGVATVSLAANTTYTFKFYSGNTWYGNSGTMEWFNSSNWNFSTNGSDCTLKTVDAGTYTFTLNGTSLSVTYPNMTTVYFYNNLGWATPYVYLLGSAYWDSTQGSGSYAREDGRVMTRIGETNIWKLDYPSSKKSKYIAFVKSLQNNYGNFWDTEAVYREDFNSENPLFVPDKDLPDNASNHIGNFNYGESNTKWTRYWGGYWYAYPATYTRTVTTGNLGTICLPFDATVTGATVYKITGTKFESEVLKGIYVEPVENLVAGNAYIFQATSTTLTATFCGNPTTTANEADGMLGNLSSTPVSVPTGNYIIKDNLIRKVAAGTITIGQYKAYITLNKIGETSSPYFIGADDATGIEGLEIEKSQNEIYNLQGQRVTNIEKGVYIINGKKVLVK